MNLKDSQRLTHMLVKATDQSGRLGRDAFPKSGNRTVPNREDPEFMQKGTTRHD